MYTSEQPKPFLIRAPQKESTPSYSLPHPTFPLILSEKIKEITPQEAVVISELELKKRIKKLMKSNWLNSLALKLVIFGNTVLVSLMWVLFRFGYVSF